MNFFRISVFIFWMLLMNMSNARAQFAATIDQMETQHKECLRIKADSTPCSRTFLIQMDSMMNVIFEQVKAQAPADEKSALVQDQVSWAKKKGEFYKKQDETFVYNLQEGIWKKDMIRITYQQKADYLLKRINVLLKKLQK